MLRKLTDLSVQAIVATSLMVVALVSIGGVGSAVIRSTAISWGAASIFTAATVMGMLTGRKLIQKISPSYVQAGFSVLLMLVASGLWVKALMM